MRNKMTYINIYITSVREVYGVFKKTKKREKKNENNDRKEEKERRKKGVRMKLKKIKFTRAHRQKYIFQRKKGRKREEIIVR